MGQFTDWMPSRFMPRRMKGKTVVLKFGPPVLPQDAIEPAYLVVRMRYARVEPPTESTLPAQRSFSRGRLLSAAASWRSRKSLAPNFCRQSWSDDLPVLAEAI